MASTEVVRPRRPRQTAGDMARSLGLMAVVIAALLFLGPARSLLFPGADRMPAVDFTSAVHAFVVRAGNAALVPATSLRGWRPTTAEFTEPRHAAHLHIGWAVPGSRYAGLDEATGSPPALLRSVLGAPGAQVQAVVDVGGVRWQQRLSSRGEEALSRTAGGVTVVVTGNASDAELRMLIDSLH